MSDIKPGDLVMVVRPATCCGNGTALGRVFQVMEAFTSRQKCCHCGSMESSYCAVEKVHEGELFGYPTYRLIRIDPPALPESVETTEELTA